MSILKVKYRKIDSDTMLLHTQIASGTVGIDKEKYQFIKDTGNRVFVLEYKGKKYEILVVDLIRSLLGDIEK